MRLPFVVENTAGHPIRGEVRAPARGRDRGTILFCHGFKGFWNWGGFPAFLDAAASQGFFAIGFSFSGSGVVAGDRVDEPERFAENTFTRQVADLREMVALLRRGKLAPFGRPPGPIGVVGHSMGGGVAILAAADGVEADAIATWGGVSTIERFPPEVIAEWRERGFTTITNARTGQELRMSTAFLEDLDAHRDALDIVKAAARLRTPILVVHGEEDESVPLIEAHAIHGALPDGAHARLLTVPGAGHTFGVTHPYAGSTPEFDRVVSETLGWFRATLVREESVTPATEVGHRLPV